MSRSISSKQCRLVLSRMTQPMQSISKTKTKLSKTKKSFRYYNSSLKRHITENKLMKIKTQDKRFSCPVTFDPSPWLPPCSGLLSPLSPLWPWNERRCQRIECGYLILGSLWWDHILISLTDRRCSCVFWLDRVNLSYVFIIIPYGI